MRKLWIDIETRSRIDLKRAGVYRYVRCPDFRILMAAWSTDGESIQTSFGEKIMDIPGLWDPEVLKVAHNAQFERVCFSTYCGWTDLTRKYLPPEFWHDTQAVAAELGYPRSLERLAEALGGEQKDSAGTRLINLFSKPNRRGGWNDASTHPDEWLEFIAYCVQDVRTLIDVDRRLGDFPTETERQVYLADQRINDRGIKIDVRLARAAHEADRVNQLANIDRIREISTIDNPASQPQIMRWIREQRLPANNARSETLDTLLATELSPTQREVLELRQEVALAAAKKYASALYAVMPDGRLRGTLSFFGAHTGRWAGRGTQPQNLPSLSFKSEAEQAAAILDLELGLGGDPVTLKKLVRPMFLGPLTVVDYNSIEARVIAWLAGEEWVLEAARAGRDLYVETASRMGSGFTRDQGKIATLALGFNGGKGALRRMGATGTDNELNYLRDQWRAANPRIVNLWWQLESRLRKALGGQPLPAKFRTQGGWTEKLKIKRTDEGCQIVLPSGRPIVYRKMDIVKRRPRGPGEDVPREYEFTYPELQFTDPRGVRVTTYGGKLAENVTQAVARDLLAEALIRLEQHGYPVVAHVHDEIIVEGEHDVDAMSKVMCELPDWAAGLPVSGEGFVCERYRKG